MEEQLVNIPGESLRFAILFTIAVPLIGSFILAAIKNSFTRDSLLILISLTLFINVVNLMVAAMSVELPEINVASIMPGLALKFKIEPLGMAFALISSFLWFVTSIYSIGYMRGNNELHQGRFYGFFALALFATMGIAFAGNLLTMFLFYEILTLVTFPLVTHHHTDEAKKAGRKYLAFLLGTSLFFFMVAIIWTWKIAGTLDFTSGGILAWKISPVVCGILLLLYVYGAGKAAVIPLHKWLPAAMVAPTPVSALLHAVAVVKAGVFVILKVIIYIFGIDFLAEIVKVNWWAGGWMPWLAAITVIAASLLALKQDNLKLMLAYSTISQLSYIVMAAGMFNSVAAVAGIFHIAAHAFGKITLFFAAGAIYTSARKKNISELDGIAKKMPITMAAFSVGALSMIGIPPAAGFLSKLYIMQGVYQNSKYLVAVLIISTLINAMYFLPIIYRAYFKNERNKKSEYGEAPITMLVAMVITAFATITLFAYPDFIIWLGNITVMR